MLHCVTLLEVRDCPRAYDQSKSLHTCYYSLGTTFIKASLQGRTGVYGCAGLYSTVDDLLIWDQALYTHKLDTIVEDGADAGVARYREQKKAQPSNAVFQNDELLVDLSIELV